MNKHIKYILENKDPELSLLENIVFYISENKAEIDRYDLADAIKDDNTFLNQLKAECQGNKMLKKEKMKDLNLTELFLEIEYDD